MGQRGRVQGRKRGKVKGGTKPGGQGWKQGKRLTVGKRDKGYEFIILRTELCVPCRLARPNATNKICLYFCYNENYAYFTSIQM